MLENYKFFELIGEGCSSRVFRAKRKDTQKDCAIKVINLANKNEHQRKLIQNEVEILSSIQCDHIIKLFEVFQIDNFTYIVTELCQFGSLEDQMKTGKILSEQQSIIFLQSMSKALLKLKISGIVHNDIKPSNIFISSNGYKLADFGFSFKSHSRNQFNLGSPYYMSPETLSKNEHTFQSDIWSLGITAYQINQGQLPYQAINEKDLYNKITNQEVLFTRETSQKFKSLIKSLLEVNPLRRMTVDNLYQMFFEKENLKPQRLHSLHSEKIPFKMASTNRKKSLQIQELEDQDLIFCQITKEIKEKCRDNELLSYALQGIILYYTKQESRPNSTILIDKKKVPNIFSMVKSELLNYCILQLTYSISEIGNQLRNKVTRDNVRQQQLQEEILILANLQNILGFIKQSNQQFLKLNDKEINYDQFIQLIQ